MSNPLSCRFLPEINMLLHYVHVYCWMILIQTLVEWTSRVYCMRLSVAIGRYREWILVRASTANNRPHRGFWLWQQKYLCWILVPKLVGPKLDWGRPQPKTGRPFLKYPLSITKQHPQFLESKKSFFSMDPTTLKGWARHIQIHLKQQSSVHLPCWRYRI